MNCLFLNMCLYNLFGNGHDLFFHLIFFVNVFMYTMLYDVNKCTINFQVQADS